MTPILFPPYSVNQRLWSGPVTICHGALLLLGREYSVIWPRTPGVEWTRGGAGNAAYAPSDAGNAGCVPRSAANATEVPANNTRASEDKTTRNNFLTRTGLFIVFSLSC